MKQMTADRGCSKFPFTLRNRPLVLVGAVLASLAGPAGITRAQSAEDAAIDTICQLDSISEGDKGRIAEWVQAQVNQLAQIPEAEGLEEANKFRTRFAARLAGKCTDAFRAEFPVQTAAVAEKVLPNPGTGVYVAYALSRVLLEMNRPETVAAMQACLKSQRQVARFLCARGLAEQKQAIAGDKEKLERLRAALREAGAAEQDPIVLPQIYRALALSNQAAVVFEDYRHILDQRLTSLRAAGNFVADGAEIEALTFFDGQGVLEALNANQKQQLVTPLAGFLQLYAARYNTEKLEFEEIDRLERSLYLTESLLDRLVDKDGGKIRDVLTSQGYAGRASVHAEAAKWIGDAETKTPGTLNGPPWNVPLGGSAQAEASARAAGSTE